MCLLVVLRGKVRHRRSTAPHLVRSDMRWWNLLVGRTLWLIVLRNGTTGWMRASTVSFVVLAGTSIFMGTGFLVADKCSNIAIITSPSSRPHVSILYRRWPIVRRRGGFHFRRIVTAGWARRSVLVVSPLMSLVVIAWSIMRVFVAPLHGNIFIGQYRCRNTSFGMSVMIRLVTPVSLLTRRYHNMLWVRCWRIGIHRVNM